MKLNYFRYITWVCISAVILSFGLGSLIPSRNLAATKLIPDESIRLRILAASDDSIDQQIKLQVRDRVAGLMSGWVNQLQNDITLAQARIIVKQHWTQIETGIQDVLQQNQANYGFKMELAKVPFPAKLYGDVLYPAGDYEALRISLGEAQGKNWWCVLFPPMCFFDAKTGEPIAITQKNSTKKIQKKLWIWEQVKKIL